jgi:hypothetical protein
MPVCWFAPYSPAAFHCLQSCYLTAYLLPCGIDACLLTYCLQSYCLPDLTHVQYSPAAHLLHALLHVCCLAAYSCCLFADLLPAVLLPVCCIAACLPTYCCSLVLVLLVFWLLPFCCIALWQVASNRLQQQTILRPCEAPKVPSGHWRWSLFMLCILSQPYINIQGKFGCNSENQITYTFITFIYLNEHFSRRFVKCLLTKDLFN